MKRQTSFFAICVLLFVCFVGVLSDNIITANFVERRDGKPYAYTTGTLYYKYDEAHPEKSRLRFKYNIGGVVFSNLYHYGDQAMFSMCSDSCTGKKLTEGADPWYNRNGYYTELKQEGGLKWYKRTQQGVTASTGAQVSAILMDDKGSGSNTIGQINFTDGRFVTLSDVKHYTSGFAAEFEVDTGVNCPRATCPIYADIVFVVDNSNSVDSNEWNQQINFVISVLDSFAFGDDAVEAAVIQFNSPEFLNYCKTKYVGGCNKCSEDTTYKKIDSTHNNETLPHERTASVLAGKEWVIGTGKTVSDDVESLKTTLRLGRPQKGHTCQAYGLELALKVLQLSPRYAYQKKPNPIVIVVTDGEDNTPNRTAKAAQAVKDFGAFLIEIGVGIGGCNDYDRNYLKSIASKAGSVDTPAYYDASDYSKIHEITEQLFKPLCDDFSTECGPDCLGFCGCGKCVCPDCEESGSLCYNVSCLASGTSSTGCYATDIPCPDGNKCVSYQCDDEKGCLPVGNDCTQLKQKNQQKCRSVSCDPYKEEGCYVDYSDSYCQDLYGNGKCVVFKCATKDEEITTGYEDSGCQLVRNLTANKINELTESGKISCYEPYCDPETGRVSEIDQCPDRLENKKCYTSKCSEVGEKLYACDRSDKGRKPDTQCVEYYCDENDGWIEKPLHTVESCTADFKKQGVTDLELLCLDVYCDAKRGCVKDDIPNCNSICDGTQIKNCELEGYQNSSVMECHRKFCDIKDESGTGNWQPYCKENTTALNCLDDKELLETINSKSSAENTAECCHATCLQSGECSYECIEKPDNDIDGKPHLCMEYKCMLKEVGFWEWREVPTEENLTCHDNTCFTRACVATLGCIDIKDICTGNTTECDLYTCDESGKIPTCVHENLLNVSTCMREVCRDGKKVREEYFDNCVEAQTNKCLIAKCVYYDENKTSWCNYSDAQPPSNDPCLVYTCNPADGTFSHTPKCNDGKYCTEDVCTVFGECKYPPVTCSELSVEGYSCFERRCRENETAQDYYCVRKLITGAFIDVCGNCIIETADSYVSGSSSEKEVDLLQCTGAPPKPLLTEGLAAASIALIILAAVIIGAAVTASGVMGTKSLVDRAKSAKNQSAHSNPLFENSDTEMTNPAFAGEM